MPQKFTLMLNGGAGSSSTLIPGDMRCEPLFSRAAEDLHRTEPCERHTNLPPALCNPPWAPEQLTVTQALGHQASLGLALTALLLGYPDWKTTKSPPLEPAAPMLSQDLTVKSQALEIFCLF